MKSRFVSFLTLALASALSLPAQSDDSSSVIKLTDPSKPASVRISLGRGTLRVEGTDAQEISVTSDTKPPARTRKDGLRELTAASSFTFSEKDNVVTIDTANDWGRSGNSNVQLKVPRATTLIVHNAWGGDIVCSRLEGDIEITSMQGAIRLDGVAGGVVASTMNGEIQASVRELKDGKPLSFTSMNGAVIVRVPETAKAHVRLRTQNGAVLTDFDESALATKTESAGGPRTRAITLRNNSKVLSVEIQDAIREATQVSATAVKEALEAMKEGLEAARLSADDARREMDRARSELDRWREKRGEFSADARAPDRAPKLAGAPPIPTITGGKLVTGTLNGGGPEISIATMNGDVTLRKLAP